MRSGRSRIVDFRAAHVDRVGGMQRDRIVGDGIAFSRVLEEDDTMVRRGGDHFREDRVL